MLDGVLILAAPLVIAYFVYRAIRGMPQQLALLWILVGVYALWAADLLFFPIIIDAQLRGMKAQTGLCWVNLIPFRTLWEQLTAPTGISPRQIGGNIGLLLPVGLIGPILAPRLRRVCQVLLASLAISACIELAQLVGTMTTFIARSVDVDDLMLNVVGALLGWLIWRLASVAVIRFRQSSRSLAQADDPG
ncbi:MAG: VanZ family protein [Coriobacteriia bacterium]